MAQRYDFFVLQLFVTHSKILSSLDDNDDDNDDNDDNNDDDDDDDNNDDDNNDDDDDDDDGNDDYDNDDDIWQPLVEAALLSSLPLSPSLSEAPPATRWL